MRRALKTMAILMLTAMIGRGAEGPDRMATIPAGVFRMGDASGEGWPDERPVRRVAVSAFRMDRWEVCASQRVVRGGSWLSGSREAERGESATRGPGYYLRCANRSAAEPDNGRHNRGFRCVRRRRASINAASNSRY